ncbi:phage tail tape measure protein [Brevibacillus agri]|uniref:phage tail tape measure protein n=1 Tax=Brevibacillus agri TaxID=51101 RepID=UPI002E1AACF9|nr:phage tail tape measure protein [Brevibacillus agri]
MARRIHEVSFAIAGKLAASFRGAFSSASYQIARLSEETDELKQELKRLENEHKSGAISTEQFTAAQERLTRAIDRQKQAHQALLHQQSRRQTHMDNGSNAAGQMGETFAKASPLIGVMVAANDYAEAQRRIQIQTSLTAQQQQQAFQITRQAHLSGLGESMSATSEAYGIMSQTIKNETIKQQQLILQGALSAEKYWGAGAMEINKAVTNLTSNFNGLSNTQALDIITYGLKNGMNYADDYLDTLYEYSPQFESLGYSAKQFYGVLEAGKRAGAWNLDKVADAAKEFNIRAKDGSKTTEDAFKALGLNSAKMAKDIAKGGASGVNAWNKTIDALNRVQDPVKRNQLGVALFGTQWEDLTEKVILNMKIMENAGQGIDGTTQKVVEASTAARNGVPSWTQLARQIQDTAAVVGNQFLPVLAPLIQNVANGAAWVGNFAQAHPQLTSVIVGATTALIGGRIAWLALRMAWSQAALIGNGLSGIFVRQAAAQAIATTATGKMTIAQRLLNLTMSLNPIGLIITGMGLLVAAGVYLYNNWDTVREKGSLLWDTLTRGASEMGVNISNFFKGMANGVIQSINRISSSINKLIGTSIPQIEEFQLDYSIQARKIQENRAARNAGEKIPAYAKGGILTRPHIGLVAEAGPEAVIPLNRSPRSISLWKQAGRSMGLTSGGGTVIHLTYAPQINGGDPNTIKPVLEENNRTLMDQLRSIHRQNERVSFGA